MRYQLQMLMLQGLPTVQRRLQRLWKQSTTRLRLPLSKLPTQQLLQQQRQQPSRPSFRHLLLLRRQPTPQLREQQRQDTRRRRGNFAVNVQLQAPLRHWYSVLESLAPGRVVFEGHLRPHVPGGELREDRYSVDLLDALVQLAGK